jgi:outer membrane immunogenic protein
MKKLLLAGISFAALAAAPALAADLARPAPVYVPPPVVVPVCVWCGFYVGVNAGGTWSSNNNVTITTVPVTTFFPGIGIDIAHGNPAAASATGVASLGQKAGFIGGGQIGYNWQRGSVVAGLEADIQGSSSKRDGVGAGLAFVGPGSGATGTPDATTFVASSNLKWLGTVRARAGFLAAPSLLAYVTGGLAYGGVEGSAGFTTVNNAYPAVGLAPVWGTAASYSTTRTGWTIGGGAEWLLTPNWSVKGEYLYYDLGSVSYALGASGSVVIPPGAPVGVLWFTNASTASQRFNGNIVRVGLNYKF